MTKLSVFVKERRYDSLNFLIGAFIASSPWILDYAAVPEAMWASVAIGVVIAVASFSAMIRFHEWEEWSTGIMGVALMASPWVLGYTMLAPASAIWVQVAMGLLVVALSAWSIWHFRHPHTA